MLGFSIKTSILYFIPKDPDNERKYVTQTALFIFASSALGLGIIYATGHIVFAKANFDFAEPLLLYVFFFLNLDFVESYWLAKKRSDYVLYYSTAKSAIKITVSMAVGYMQMAASSLGTYHRASSRVFVRSVLAPICGDDRALKVSGDASKGLASPWIFTCRRMGVLADNH